MANPSRLEKIQITGNSNSGTATKVNVQEANGEVNTQTINTGFNKNIGLGGSDVVGATTLLNQYSTTPVDWTATAFNSGQVVFYGGKQWIAKIATVAGDVPSVSSKWEEITFEALANKTVIVDATPTDGSNNAVSSNGVFDALATKAPISSVHSPVTLGTANGLSLSNQQISLGLAGSSVTGALSGTDWNTFNGKFNTPTGLTTNYLPKWNGSAFVNSNIFDNGTNIGINKSSPSAKLHIVGGSGYADNIASNSNATLKLAFADPNQIVFFGLNSNHGGTSFIQSYRDSDSASQRFIINPYGGNVGINQPVPTEQLDVVGNGKFSGTISASPATTANQVVVKSQLDAVAARPYKVYTALLSQTGTNAPTATVLENTLGGAVTWTRNSAGIFYGTLSAGVFTGNKTVKFATLGYTGISVNSTIEVENANTSIITVITRVNGIQTDGVMSNGGTSIEIRIYN